MPKQPLPRGISRAPHTNRYRTRITWQGHTYTLGTFTTLQAAQECLDRARVRRADGTFQPPKQIKQQAQAQKAEQARHQTTVQQAADRWLQHLHDEGRSPATIVSYKSTLRVHVLPTLKDTPACEVTPEVIARLTSGKTPAVRMNVQRTVRALFNWAATVTLIPSGTNPVRGRMRHQPPHDLTVATPGEVEAMAQRMPVTLRLAVLLAAWCALRKGEVLGLQRRDLQQGGHGDGFTAGGGNGAGAGFRAGTGGPGGPDAYWLTVARQWNQKASPPDYTKPKAGSVRTIAVPDALTVAVTDQLALWVGGGEDSPVFPSRVGGIVPVSHSAFDRYWQQARDAVRPGFRFHDLRHTGLTVYARCGATLKELMGRAGHTDVESALRYQHGSVERDVLLTGRVSELIAGGLEGETGGVGDAG